jgi:tRNA(Arg) A34 adenosine deaminase TadA
VKRETDRGVNAIKKNMKSAHWMHKIIKPGQIIPSEKEIMRRLIRVAEVGIQNGRKAPFVAAVVSEKGTVVSVAHNKVAQNIDSTAHAEILAIRQAQKKLKTTNLKKWKQNRLLLITTCQPCVMCSGAIHWAGLTQVVAAARHTDALKGGIAHDLMSDASTLFRNQKLKYKRDVFRKEAAQVFIEDGRGDGK